MASLTPLSQEKAIFHLGWTGVRDSSTFTSALKRTDFSDTDVTEIDAAIAHLDSADLAMRKIATSSQATRIGTMSLNWVQQRRLTLAEADRQLQLLSKLTGVRILSNKYLRSTVQEY